MRIVLTYVDPFTYYQCICTTPLLYTTYAPTLPNLMATQYHTWLTVHDDVDLLRLTNHATWLRSSQHASVTDSESPLIFITAGKPIPPNLSGSTQIMHSTRVWQYFADPRFAYDVYLPETQPYYHRQKPGLTTALPLTYDSVAHQLWLYSKQGPQLFSAEVPAMLVWPGTDRPIVDRVTGWRVKSLQLQNKDVLCLWVHSILQRGTMEMQFNVSGRLHTVEVAGRRFTRAGEHAFTCESMSNTGMDTMYAFFHFPFVQDNTQENEFQ